MNIFYINSPDKKWHAGISACHGANVVKLQYEGKDVLRPLESEEQLKMDPYIQGAPMLFPANRTYRGEFWFEGKQYFLPINELGNQAHLHGRLYCQKFELVEKKSDKIKLCFENRMEIYPFAFRVTVEYCLRNDSFLQNVHIENTGTENMPLVFGLHTTFIADKTFCVPITACQEMDQHSIPTGRYIPLNAQEIKYVEGSESEGSIIGGYYKSCGNSARIGNWRYTVSDNFDHWILYNADGKSGFLCVEPQCGAVNGLNIAGGCKIIAPQSKEVFYTSITKIGEKDK